MATVKQPIGYAERHRQKQSYTDRSYFREPRTRFKIADDVLQPRDSIQLPEIPQRPQVTTMDRSYVRRANHGNPNFHVPQYNMNVENRVLGQLVLAHDPDFGPRYMVLGKRPLRERFETRSEPVYPKRPVWNSSKKCTYIYRSVDPSFQGKYTSKSYDFRSFLESPKQNIKKEKLKLIDKKRNADFKKKLAENATKKVEDQMLPPSTEEYKEQSVNTNTPKKKQPFSKYPGNRNRVSSDYHENDDPHYLPPLERNNLNTQGPLETFPKIGYVQTDIDTRSDSPLIDSQRNVLDQSLRENNLNDEHEPEVLTHRQVGGSNDVTPQLSPNRGSKSPKKGQWVGVF